MKKFVPSLVALGAVVLVLASCAPTTVTPMQTKELVTDMSYQDAYAAVVNVVNTQPYPSDSGGWILTQSDQVGGFVSAQLNGRRCSLFGCTNYVGRVSVALVKKSDGATAVSISLNRLDASRKLADNIRARLGI